MHWLIDQTTKLSVIVFAEKCNLFTLIRSQVSHIYGDADAWISGARDICSYHGPGSVMTTGDR